MAEGVVQSKASAAAGTAAGGAAAGTFAGAAGGAAGTAAAPWAASSRPGAGEGELEAAATAPGAALRPASRDRYVTTAATKSRADAAATHLKRPAGHNTLDIPHHLPAMRTPLQSCGRGVVPIAPGKVDYKWFQGVDQNGQRVRKDFPVVERPVKLRYGHVQRFFCLVGVRSQSRAVCDADRRPLTGECGPPGMLSAKRCDVEVARHE